MFNIKFLLVVLCCFTTLLTGCAQQPQSTPTISLQSRQAYLNHMQHWQANCRVAIRDKDHGHNLTMQWHENQQQYNIQFFGPLGSGSIKIIGKPGALNLTTSDGNSYTATNADNLIYEHLGWDLPFASLTYWLKGLAALDTRPMLIKYDAYNQLQSLQQSGWLINYQNYMVYDAITLPEKITLTKGDIKLKIIVHQWRVIELN